jgi:hypothetical protein
VSGRDARALADLAGRVTRAQCLAREALRAFPKVAAGNQPKRALSDQEAAQWLLKRGRAETGDLGSRGLPAVRRDSDALLLERPGSGLRLRFTSESRARYVELAVRSLLASDERRRPRSIAAVLDAPLPVPVGQGVSDGHVAQALAEMDGFAKERGEPDCDLTRLDHEVARAIDTIDAKVRALYGLVDVPVDDLRNPGAVF